MPFRYRDEKDRNDKTILQIPIRVTGSHRRGKEPLGTQCEHRASALCMLTFFPCGYIRIPYLDAGRLPDLPTKCRGITT